MAAAEYDSDDVEMEIEDEEDETTVHKDNSKALKGDNTMLQEQQDVSTERMTDGSATKKWEAKIKKMEDDLESSVASGGKQR